jgi:hypothetical protein
LLNIGLRFSTLHGAKRSRQKAIQALGNKGADTETIGQWNGTAEQFHAVLDGARKLRELYPEVWDAAQKEGL